MVRRALLALLLVVVPAMLGVAAEEADTGRTYFIADFEDPGCLEYLSSEDLTFVRIEARIRSEGHYLRAVADDDPAESLLCFERVPADIRKFEALTLRARDLLDPVAELRFCLVDVEGRLLELPFSIEGKAWSEVRVPLSRGRPEHAFDPAQVESLCLLGCEALEVDDVAIVAGHGDWRVDGDDLLAAFGESRVRRVRRVRTRHFDVCTDSIAVRGRFMGRLERTYEFVRDALPVQDVDSHLPVFMFQSQGDFVGYLMRVYGYSRSSASGIAGIASRRGFATWYMSPQSPVVTHELTHAVFGHVVGRGGGPWLQEGAAVYVTSLHAARSAARVFSNRLRNGRYVPLADFMSLRSVANTRDQGGRRFSPVDLYEQSGAFFEFLMRGPLFADEQGRRVPGLPPQIRALAEMTWGPSLAEIETALGFSVAEVEQAWIRWGSRPPRR